MCLFELKVERRELAHMLIAVRVDGFNATSLHPLQYLGAFENNLAASMRWSMEGNLASRRQLVDGLFTVPSQLGNFGRIHEFGDRFYFG